MVLALLQLLHAIALNLKNALDGCDHRIRLLLILLPPHGQLSGARTPRPLKEIGPRRLEACLVNLSKLPRSLLQINSRRLIPD